jgi:hypothetical protein
MIKSSKSIRCLSLVKNRRDRSISSLPSWVSDFRWSGPISLDWGGGESVFGLPTILFNAAGGLTYDGCLQTGVERYLIVEGYCYAKVKHSCILNFWDLSTFQPLLDILNEIPADILWRTLDAGSRDLEQSIAEVTRHMSTLLAMVSFQTLHISMIRKAVEVPFNAEEFYAADKRFSAAFMTYMKLPGVQHLSAIDGGPFLRLHQEVRDCLLASLKSHLPIETLEQAIINSALIKWLSTQHPMQHDELCVASKTFSRLAAMNFRRAMFQTVNRRIGFGPESVSEGDEIWILVGTKVPYILRKLASDGYELIGEAYIHGIMFGESVRSGKGRLQKITLR